jgi:hypothetical protein
MLQSLAMRVQGVAACVVLAATTGCATYVRPVSKMSELRSGEKVLVGDIRIDGGDLDKWVSGIYLRSWAEFTNGETGSDYKRGSGGMLEKTGGVFHIAVANDRDVHLAGIYVQSTIPVFVNLTTFFPTFVKLAHRDGACEYVGTFVLRKRDKKILVSVVDTFERDKRSYASYVDGCVITNAAPPYDNEAARPNVLDGNGSSTSPSWGAAARSRSASPAKQPTPSTGRNEAPSPNPLSAGQKADDE